MRQNQHNVKRHMAPSKPMRLGATLLLVLGSTAHLVANIAFQSSLAHNWVGMTPHIALALLAVGGAVLGAHILVHFGRAGSTSGVIMALMLLVISCASTAVSASGFYSHEERKNNARVTARSRNEGLDDTQITSLREQIAALKGGGGGETTSPRIIQLQTQRAELATQRDEYRKDGVISKGVNVIQPKIDALDSQIAEERAQLAAVAGASSKENASRLSALQTQLSAAIAGAKKDTGTVAEDVNAATALFDSIGKTWGVDPEMVKSRFFVWQPVALEVCTLVLSFISALLSPLPSRRPIAVESYDMEDAEEYEDIRKPLDVATTRPRDIRQAAVAVTDSRIRDVVPIAPAPAPKTEEAVELPQIAQAKPESTTGNLKPNLETYVAEIFQGWTPEAPKLTGKLQVAKRLGLGRHDAIALHNRVRSSPFYAVEAGNQSWARFTGRNNPKSREEAAAKFLDSLTA